MLYRTVQLVCLLLVCSAAAYAQESQKIYKWVDEDGVVHYSDQPIDGAEVISIEPRTASPSRNARPPAPLTRPRQGESANEAAASGPFAYESLSFTSPSPEETLWNIGGTLNVALGLTPGLRSSDRIRLYFDGEARTLNSTQTVLEEVWRGTHNLQAEVLDANGELMIRSEPIRFYVQQTSIQN